jgi:hypothetical protein
VLVFTPPLLRDAAPVAEPVLLKDDNGKPSNSDDHDERTHLKKDVLLSALGLGEPTYGTLSLSSQTSSCVDVVNSAGTGTAERTFSDGEGDGELDAEEEDDAWSFLSDSLGSEVSPDNELSGGEASSSPEASDFG